MTDRLAASGLVPTDVDATEVASTFTSNHATAGFKLPYWYPDGTPHPVMHRVRLEHPPPGAGKYSQPSKEDFVRAMLPDSDATHPYLNPKILGGLTWAEYGAQKGKYLLVVEGELKAAWAGKYLRRAAIGIGGCSNATRADPLTGVHTLHPVIKSLLQPGDRVEICLDGDIDTNENVNRAAGTMRRVFLSLGFQPTFVLLPL